MSYKINPSRCILSIKITSRPTAKCMSRVHCSLHSEDVNKLTVHWRISPYYHNNGITADIVATGQLPAVSHCWDRNTASLLLVTSFVHQTDSVSVTVNVRNCRYLGNAFWWLDLVSRSAATWCYRPHSSKRVNFRSCHSSDNTTRWVKKIRHQTFGRNFTNYYPIKKIFSSQLGSKFATNSCLNISPRFKHVATLPCEIYNNDRLTAFDPGQPG